MKENNQHDDGEILEVLLEYCKYLYEEEKYRKDSLTSAVKIYLAFLTFVLGIGAFKAFPLEELSSLLSRDGNNELWILLAVILLSAAVCAFFIAVINTIRVLKVWRFERLTDPKTTAIQSALMKDKNELLLAIISDYVVACNRYHEINERKANLLSRGLIFLIVGLVLFVISLFFINGILLLNGG